MKLLSTCLLALQMLTAYDTVFILHDAAETQALLPVIDVYLRNQEDICLLTGGPATEILAGKPKTLSFDQVGINEKVDKTWQRESLLSPESIRIIVEKLPAKRVISGVTYELYGQLLEAYAPSITFAYWDNINYEGDKPLPLPKVAEIAQHLLLSSQPPTTLHPQQHIVGQPALEREEICELDASKIRSRLPFPLKSPIVVFFGGYGRTYNKALSLFLTAAEDLSDYTILLLPHPRTEGAIERKKLSHRTLAHVHLVEPSWNISATEISLLATRVICDPTITGIHAAVAEKNVMYWIPAGFLTDNGAPHVGTLAELKTYLMAPQKPPRDIFEILKAPRDSARLIYTTLHSPLF